jgi:hypothetical protein
MKQWLYWIGGALLISFIIIYIFPSSSREDLSNKTELELFYDLQDTIRYYKNKDGSSTAQIKLLEADKKSLGKVLALKNKSLSDLLKSGSTSATVFETLTVYDTITKVRIDTVNSKPSFKNQTKDNWIELNIELKNDSLKKSIVLRDSLSVSFKKVPQGFLKRKKSVVEVKNYNPYVKINNLQSFDVTEKRVNLLFPGIAIGAVGALILLK